MRARLVMGWIGYVVISTSVSSVQGTVQESPGTARRCASRRAAQTQAARLPTGVPGKIYEFSEINLDLTVESDAKCVHWVAQPIPHVLTERYFA